VDPVSKIIIPFFALIFFRLRRGAKELGTTRSSARV
jgi:hypothetical protein